MKAIVISREGGDFSMDLIWAGLARRLGPQNVFDWPLREKHRQGIPKITGDVESDYGSERRSLCYTGCTFERKERRDIINIVGMDDVIIFLDEREESYLHWLEITKFFSHLIPTVVIAGHDRFWNVSPSFVRGEYYGINLLGMFIDDWQKEYDLLSWAHLINLSINFDHLWDSSKRYELMKNKVYDLCFMGYNSTDDRARFVDHIERRWGYGNNHIVLEKRQGAMDRFVRHEEFFQKIAMSKVCLNVRGASTGGRALRYYEIPYVGSFMLSQTFPAKLLNPFREMEHCSYFSDEEELDRKIEWFLSHDEERERIARYGHGYAMENHHIDSRINYMFDVIINEDMRGSS